MNVAVCCFWLLGQLADTEYCLGILQYELITFLRVFYFRNWNHTAYHHVEFELEGKINCEIDLNLDFLNTVLFFLSFTSGVQNISIRRYISFHKTDTITKVFIAEDFGRFWCG